LWDGRVHQLVREAIGCATTGAKQVRHRGLDKCICAAACAEKGSSSKHLTFGSFCQEKERSPAGKATMIIAPKFEWLLGDVFYYSPTFKLDPAKILSKLKNKKGRY